MNVPLQYLHSVGTGIRSIAIHDEGNMLRYWARSEHGKGQTRDLSYGLVAKSIDVWRERHCHLHCTQMDEWFFTLSTRCAGKSTFETEF